jgi:uncharacterized protein YdhG (YjbR/CyaY superfamily)
MARNATARRTRKTSGGAKRKRAAKPTAGEDRASVRAYFASMPPAQRKALATFRNAIRSAAPGAVEAFSYRIPAIRLEGRIIVWYAAFKNHVSLFPIGAAILRAHAAAAEGYETSTGTIRFPLDEPVPVTLVKRLVRARIGQVREKETVTGRRAAGR